MKALDELMERVDTFTRNEWNTLDNGMGAVVEMPREVLKPAIVGIEQELEECYVLLPLDKDGVPIHVGDEMVSCGRHRFRFIVSELDFTDAFVHAIGIVGGTKYFFKPSEIVHYHEKPIEDMLRNLVTKARQIDVDGSPMLKENDIRELSDKLQLKEESE